MRFGQVVCWSVGLLAPGVLWGQEEAARSILAVEFTGLHRTTAAFAQDIVRVRAGDRHDKAALDEAVARLLRTGRFQTADYKLDEQPAGVRVIFEVHERPIVSSIKFEGNSKFREGQLKDSVTQKVGEVVDWFAVRDGREAVIAKYKEAGYGDVAVTYDQDRVERAGELVYTIQEGPQVRIRKILFEGNASLPARELRKELETKTAFWFFRTGAFDKDQVEGDVARVQNHYRDQGFLDAKVAYRKELSADGKDLRIVFTVEEGTRYSIEDLQFHGNAAIATEELNGLLGSRVGETVKRPQVDADVKAVQERYGSLGYIDAKVRAVRVFSEKPAFVRITVEIEEGGQFRVGRVAVRGNARTKDKVVRRALNLYPPDDLFNMTEAKEAEKRLVDTRIFSSARVLPVGDQPGVRDAVIDVVEAEKAGDFLFGVGVTSNSGLVGSIVLDLQNFDIFDRPRTWAEFFKLRSFFGGGQRLRVELQPGTNVNRFRIDFTEPYLFDKPLRFDESLYLFERKRDGYTESRIGQSTSLGKRFERGRLQGWTGELALRTEMIGIDDVNLFTSKEIRKDEGSSLLTGVKASLVRDRTDNRFIPSKGDRFRISYEQVGLLGGDYSFGKATTAYNWYKTLAVDRLDRKKVLQLRAEGGTIVGDAPVFERFYAGGTGSIRGFKFRGIGERDGLDHNNIGGDYLLLLGAEYSYPLYGENLRGHVFLDTGTAGAGAYRAAVGTGVRLTINLFGPLPLEFNLAMPIASGDGDDEQVFSFLVGGIF
jgi:outer membrane protein insertion porin family